MAHSMNSFKYSELIDREWICTDIEIIDHFLNLKEDDYLAIGSHITAVGTISSGEISFKFNIFGDGGVDSIRDAFEFDYSINYEVCEGYETKDFILIYDDGEKASHAFFRNFCTDVLDKISWETLMREHAKKEYIEYISDNESES